MEDAAIGALTGDILLDRKELFAKFKAIIITKPSVEDFKEMQDGTLL